MDRRRFLAALATGWTAGTAGCADRRERGGGTDADREPGRTRVADSGADRSARPTATDPGATPGTAPPLARQGFPQTICSEPVAADPGIYAVTDPAFADDWTGVSPDSHYRPSGVRTPVDGSGLGPDHTVVGLSGAWGSRAYPLGVLWHHEVVNDVLPGDGPPVLLTYCPLCRSGLVACRVVDGAPATFLVTGLLWQAPGVEAAAAAAADEGPFGAARASGGTPAVRNTGNLVMVDRATRSYWSQILARAICGPATGTRLDVRPSTVATWREWREANPGTDVLLPPPRSGTVEPGAIEAGTPPRSDSP